MNEWMCKVNSCRPDLTVDERAIAIEELVREITSLWQTDELRRRKPTPLDEARGGLHIVEQSLWNAVPAYLRRVSSALRTYTGRFHARLRFPKSATQFMYNPDGKREREKRVLDVTSWSNT